MKIRGRGLLYRTKGNLLKMAMLSEQNKDRGLQRPSRKADRRDKPRLGA